jgi:hypothetical protein
VRLVGSLKGRIKRIMVVALAHEPLLALWRYLGTGLVPTGAVASALTPAAPARPRGGVTVVDLGRPAPWPPLSNRMSRDYRARHGVTKKMPALTATSDREGG